MLAMITVLINLYNRILYGKVSNKSHVKELCHNSSLGNFLNFDVFTKINTNELPVSKSNYIEIERFMLTQTTKVCFCVSKNENKDQ